MLISTRQCFASACMCRGGRRSWLRCDSEALRLLTCAFLCAQRPSRAARVLPAPSITRILLQYRSLLVDALVTIRHCQWHISMSLPSVCHYRTLYSIGRYDINNQIPSYTFERL